MSEIEYITAPTIEECTKKLNSLYGKNYTVFKKRWVKKGGFLGFFQHDEVQVSYFVTEQTPNIFTTAYTKREPERDFDTEREKILGLSRNPNGTYTQTVNVPEKKAAAPADEDPSYQKILEEMKSIRNDLSEMKVADPQDDEPETIVKIRTLLEDNEFSPAYTRGIINRIKKEFSLQELEDYAAVRQAVYGWIQESIVIDEGDEAKKAKVVILVGPTGVGKTTTVVKLAALFAPPSQSFAPSTKARIMTIDMFKIGGVEQIEKYANLMGIGFNTCKNGQELQEKITQFAPEVETILVDTMGLSPKDLGNINKMKEMLSLKGITTTIYFTMMASTKTSDMRELLKQYEIFDYDSIIITKLDETQCVGNLISAVSENNKKFAWYTTGQRVPIDLEKASAAKLMEMIHGFEAERSEGEKVFPAE